MSQMGLESIPELSITDASSLHTLNGFTVQDLKVGIGPQGEAEDLKMRRRTSQLAG